MIFKSGPTPEAGWYALLKKEHLVTDAN